MICPGCQILKVIIFIENLLPSYTNADLPRAVSTFLAGVPRDLKTTFFRGSYKVKRLRKAYINQACAVGSWPQVEGLVLKAPTL